MTTTICTIGLDAYQPGVVAMTRSALGLDPAARVLALHPSDRPYDARHCDLIEGAGGRTVALDFSALRRALAAQPRASGRHGEETFAKVVFAAEATEPFWWVDCDAVLRRRLTCLAPSMPTSHACRLFSLPDGSINAGVVWFDPGAMRARGTLAAFFDALTRGDLPLSRGDEDVFERLRGRAEVGALPPETQSLIGWASGERDGAVVHHYAGHPKPWMPGAPAPLRARWEGDLRDAVSAASARPGGATPAADPSRRP